MCWLRQRGGGDDIPCLKVEGTEEIPMGFIVLHDTVVAINTEIQFTLKVGNRCWLKLKGKGGAV